MRAWVNPKKAHKNKELDLDFADAIFDFEYTFDGLTRTTTWPSGTLVDTTWAGSWRLQDEVHDGTTSIASVSYDYDEYGLPAGWEGGPLEVDVSRIDPDRVEVIRWFEDSYELQFEHNPNGLLKTKRHKAFRSRAATSSSSTTTSCYASEPSPTPADPWSCTATTPSATRRS